MKLAKIQFEHAWKVVLLAFAIALASVPLLLRLRVNADLREVLPDSAPAVRDLDTIRASMPQATTIALAVQDPDTEELHAFVRALATELESRKDLQIVSVDSNIGDFEQFVTKNRFLYADTADLEALKDALSKRMEWEKQRANPFYIALDDDPPPDPQAAIDHMKQRADDVHARFPGGFYQHPSLPMDFVFVRTTIKPGEAEPIQKLVAGIEESATKVQGHAANRTRTGGTDVAWVGDEVRIDYGAELMDMEEENAALQGDAMKSGVVTLGLLLAVVIVFFGRARAVPLLFLVLIPPCAVTFGIAQLVVHQLNASTAFLGSIVVGNGVNASIMWLGRYFEERRAGKLVPEAIAGAHRGTWSGTLAATIAASLAYGSLMVTDYRGFRDFGFIGALGMALCWAAAYLVLASLVTIGERIRPMTFARDRKGVYGVLFSKLAFASPRTVLGGALLLSIVSGVAIAVAAKHDPLEYDFRNLQAVRAKDSRVDWVNARLEETVEETRVGGALAVLAPTIADVPEVKRQLDAYRMAHPGTIGDVRTMDDFLPSDQERKIAILADLRALALEARPHLEEDKQKELDENLPPETIVPVGRNDLPPSIARPFTERDGTMGRLLFVEHVKGSDTWDGKYMIQWAAGARSSDRHAAVGGGAAVFADLLTTIFRDGPKVVAVSFALTVILLLCTFRKGRARWLALGAMLAGVLWMTGMLAIAGVKLNFLNLVAWPITFGIGVEYPVNYLKRYLEERRTSTANVAARKALEGAGGAVILCSLTTLIGYISLYASTNRALNSFGLAMALGEVSCIAASVVLLPALLTSGSKRSSADPATPSPSTEALPSSPLYRASR